VFHRGEGITLLTGDAGSVLAGLPAGSVDCVVTSPPYWRLRDYTPTASPDTDSRQIGVEPTAQDYIAHLREVFAGLRRVLTARGTVWLNLGDSYSTNSDGYHVTRSGQARQPRYRPVADVPHKNLLGMPWRVALALQADGWILRSAVVWHKPTTTPNPVRDRVASRHEHVFLLVTQPDHYFDLDAIGEPFATGDRRGRRCCDPAGSACSSTQGGHHILMHAGAGLLPYPGGRSAGDVWSLPPDRGRAGHPAVFPVALPLRCVAAGSPTGGHVLDPFSGAGSTGIAARMLERRFTGIDLHADYHHLAVTRLAGRGLIACASGGPR
jgi:DNA modification methylase